MTYPSITSSALFSSAILMAVGSVCRAWSLFTAVRSSSRINDPEPPRKISQFNLIHFSENNLIMRPRSIALCTADGSSRRKWRIKLNTKWFIGLYYDPFWSISIHFWSISWSEKSLSHLKLDSIISTSLTTDESLKNFAKIDFNPSSMKAANESSF